MLRRFDSSMTTSWRPALLIGGTRRSVMCVPGCHMWGVLLGIPRKLAC